MLFRSGELLRAVARGELTMVSAKQVYANMLDHGEGAEAAIARLGLRKVTDEGVLAPLVAAAVASLPQAVAAVQRGEVRALDALKGQVMQATRGRGDPAVVDRLLRAALGLPPNP